MSGSVVFIFYLSMIDLLQLFLMMEGFFKLNMLKKQLILESLNIKFRTILGIRCKDGVIIASEKMLTSKLMVKGTN
jgi:hypothetical protein